MEDMRMERGEDGTQFNQVQISERYLKSIYFPHFFLFLMCVSKKLFCIVKL